MAEPSTPSPSEPPPEGDLPEPGQPPGSGTETPAAFPERPRIKLRKILTPLSPHLTAPRPERDPRLAPKEPHAPAPRAVPIEPEPEPGPLEAPGQTDQAPQAGEPAAAAEGEPARAAEEIPPDDAAGEAAAPAGEPALAQAPAPRRRGRAGLLAAGAVAIVAMAAAYFLLDPFGADLQPIQPMPAVAAPPVQAAEKPAVQQRPVAQAANPAEATTEDFLGRLRGQKIRASANPRGAFINSVFVPEGAVLQPKLGLVLTGVDTTKQAPALLIEDAFGNTYRVEFNP